VGVRSGAAFPHLNLPPPGADRGRYVATLVMQNFPSPLMGEGLGGGETTAFLPPILTFPHQGGRDLYLPLSARKGGSAHGDQCRGCERAG
jgi:hypothetical protein